MSNEKGFVDFILDAKDNRQLLMNFMQIPDAGGLKTFFDDNGYTIKESEIGKIMEARTFLSGISRPHDDDRY
jgi:hypothetical protein